MKMSHSETGLRVTEFTWLWGAIGAPLAVLFTWQSVVHLRSGNRPGETVIVILAAIFTGTVATVLTQWSDFRFDAAARELVSARRSVFCSKRVVVAFDRIRFAVVQFSWGGDPKGPRDSYRVALSTVDKGIPLSFSCHFAGIRMELRKLTEDGNIPLTVSYSSGRVSDDRCRHIRSAINELLGVRLASEDDNDILELDRSGNHVWAVLFAQKRHGLNSTAAHEYLKKLCGEGTP